MHAVHDNSIKEERSEERGKNEEQEQGVTNNHKGNSQRKHPKENKSRLQYTTYTGGIDTSQSLHHRRSE